LSEDDKLERMELAADDASVPSDDALLLSDEAIEASSLDSDE
jgi:hypothetical protein